MALFVDHFSEFLFVSMLQVFGDILGLMDGPKPRVALEKLELTSVDYDELSDLPSLVPNLLFRALKVFPAVIRKGLEGMAIRTMQDKWYKLIQKHYSPLLISRELQRVRQTKISDLTLRVEHTSTLCSVMVEYHFDDFALNFQLVIPPEYPLKTITVNGIERLGVSEAKWRAWLLSIQSLLNLNLSVVEVIRRWKADAEKTLQGFEPCSICYCVLQPGDRSLPGPSCKTCKNKFHSSCLYKWFKTGGQATCPMCRSLF